MKVCPACGSIRRVVQVNTEELHRESDLRERFVSQRLQRRPEEPERMDLTAFMHGGTGRLVACARCGVLFREHGEPADYEHDTYDGALMTHLYPRYVQAFRGKRAFYEPLIRARAEVLEIGSHLGAFLQAAEEWAWGPTGLDFGQATAEFARRKGLSVKKMPVEDYSPRLGRPDAIFIWNCFEQLPDPGAALRQSHRLLRRNGILVVRVPSARFYRCARERPWSESALRSLGYNNLLGFPYLFGYSSSTLTTILTRHGFAPVASHNSNVLTPPYPEMPGWVRREWSQVQRAGWTSPIGEGPWIEIAARRVDS